MALNWGGFAGGLASGFNQGVNMGTTLKTLNRQREIEDLQKQAAADAQAARQAELDAASQNVVESVAPRTGQVAPDTATATTQAVPLPTVSTSPMASGMAPAVGSRLSGPASDDGSAPAPSFTPAAAQGLPSAAPAMPAPTPAATPKAFMVGDQGFDTREAATKAAQKNVGSPREFFVKVAAPQISQRLLDMGEVEKSQAWDQYAQQQQTQQNMETWGKMARAAAAGNYEKAADHAFELYKHYDDGVTPVSKEVVKDDKGNVTGFNITLKDDATGEKRAQFVGTREITELGLSALSPPAMFEQMYKRQSAADAAGAAARVKAAHDAQTFQREVVKQGMIDARQAARDTANNAAKKALAEAEHGYKLEQITAEGNIKLDNLKQGEKNKIQGQIDILKEQGYQPDEIKAMLPGLMKVGEFKKSTDPAERRAMITTELAKDPLFMRKSLEEKNKAVDDIMSVAGTPQEPRRPAKPGAAPAATPTPAANPNAGKTPVYDTKTGQIVYR